MDMYETVLGWQSLISVRSAGMYTVVFVPRSRISRDGWTQADALAEVERLSSNPLCQHLSHVTWKQIHWTRYWITSCSMWSARLFKRLRPSFQVLLCSCSMESWELGSGAATQPAKKFAVGPDKQLTKAVHAIAKLSLKNALEVRELQAAMLRTFLVPKPSPYVQSALVATKEFTDRAKQARDGKGQFPAGEPHVHAWAALLRTAIDDTALFADDKEVIQVRRDGSPDADSLLQLVMVCKVMKAFDRDSVKLQFAVHSCVEPTLAALSKGIVAHGGKQKMGQAPRAGLEREAQDIVDELSAAVSIK